MGILVLINTSKSLSGQPVVVSENTLDVALLSTSEVLFVEDAVLLVGAVLKASFSFHYLTSTFTKTATSSYLYYPLGDMVFAEEIWVG